MAIRYNIDRWPTCGSLGSLMASNYGAHILSIQVDDDTWNGAIVGVGDWIDFEYYEEAEPTTFEGKIVMQLPNGEYLVQVTAAENAFLISNPPVVETEWTNDFKQEKNFYIPAGELGRGHELKVYDRFSLSADGFEGEPEVGATITSISGKKPVVSAPVSA